MGADKYKNFENVHNKIGKIWLAFVAIHILFLLGVVIAGKWDAYFFPTPIPVVLIWIFVNDYSGLFGTVFAAGCFTRESIIGKIICYPIGLLILMMMLFTLSFPFLFIGIIGGAIAQFTFSSRPVQRP